VTQIEELQMQEIAHVRSKLIPPCVVFAGGKLKHLFRIYSDKSGKFCTVLCEIPLRSEGAYVLSSALLDWAEAKNVKELIVLDDAMSRGLPNKRQTFCATEPESIEKCKTKGMERYSDRNCSRHNRKYSG
jgi:uncharacterized protein